jgi:hypothetical protein
LIELGLSLPRVPIPIAMCDLFGERGIHSRTAVGVATLPRRAVVAFDAIFLIDCADLAQGRAA